MVSVLVQRNDMMLVRWRLDHLLHVNGMAQFFDVLPVRGNVEDGREGFGEFYGKLGSLLTVEWKWFK